MKGSYFTISGSSEGFYKEKGSKFLAFAYHIVKESDIKERIEELRKKFFDARHHCYAYVLGNEASQYRANDDGEPNHSAGDPILGQIRSRELTNTLVVVIRYFGGTKLGVPGLINAYKSAAADALKKSEVVEKFVTKHIVLTFGYEDLNAVMRLIKEFEIDVVEQTMEMDCRMLLEVRESLVGPLTSKIDQIHTIKLISS